MNNFIIIDSNTNGLDINGKGKEKIDIKEKNIHKIMETQGIE